MLSPLPLHFRQRWPSDAYPMVVVHEASQNEHVCPAPSLWTGGKANASWLRSQGIGPGHAVAVDLPPGPDWIWWFVACLREGACFVPVAPGQVLKGAAVSVSGQTPARLDGGRLPESWRVAFGQPGAGGELTLEALEGVSEPELLALAAAVASLFEGEAPRRLFSRHPWHSAPGLLVECFAALYHGAEIHVTSTPEALASVEAVAGPADLQFAAWPLAGLSSLPPLPSGAGQELGWCARGPLPEHVRALLRRVATVTVGSTAQPEVV